MNRLLAKQKIQKKEQLHDQGSGPASEEGQRIGYVQNSEQNSNSIWNRIKHRDS